MVTRVYDSHSKQSCTWRDTHTGTQVCMDCDNNQKTEWNGAEGVFGGGVVVVVVVVILVFLQLLNVKTTLIS